MQALSHTHTLQKLSPVVNLSTVLLRAILVNLPPFRYSKVGMMEDPQYFSCRLAISAKAPSRQRGCQQNTFSRELTVVMVKSGMSPTGHVFEHTWSPEGGAF